MTTTAPSIVVVGGVAGGASAATRARRMNEHARIVLFEKDAHVSFANCGLPYHVGGEIADREKLLVARPELFERRFGIEVHTKHEVLAIDRAAKTVRVKDAASGRTFEEHYDKLILAPGARPLVPPLPGVHAAGVFTLRNLEDTDRIVAALAAARRAVVVGGGFIGLEMVEQLRTRGLDVALVEREAQVLPILDAEMAEPLHRELETHGVRLFLGRAIAAVESARGRASGVRLADGTLLPTDIVILGLGVRPNTSLASDAGIALGASGGIATDEHMRTSDRDVYAVGDAAEYAVEPVHTRGRVPLAGPANRTGRLAGEHAAAGSGAPAPAAWGTSIVRVFEKTAGMTGMSLRAARKAGLDARSVHVTANHHSGYFPGAEPMVLKLVYEAGTGRLLGGQAVGGHGVDKRLDVLATTLHHRGSVHDLAALDLAYAPPFGAAKDPVHIAAFVAQNDLAGVARVLPPDADLAGFQVVDVRTADEVARLPLADAPHAVNIPLDDLRRRIAELDPSQPTVVTCWTGQRSHAGVRILSQRGFPTVWNLSGGASVRDLSRNRETPASAAPAGGCSSQAPAPCSSAGSASAAEPGEAAPADLAAALASGCADVIDVRTGAEYRASRVRGARHAPLDALDPSAVRAGRAASSAGPTYVLCQGGSRARMAAAKLKAAGVDCVVVTGGTSACIAAGLPVERSAGARVWSIERQVRFVAGLLVLAGVLVGWFVHPAGLFLAGFVGAGLTFAGATDFCGMGLVLARCPWNR